MTQTIGTNYTSKSAKKYAPSGAVYNIIEFATSAQGLGIKLFPSQRFFLKVIEKLPLDDTVCDIEVRDRFNIAPVHTFTEKGFYKYLLGEGKINLTYEEYCESEIIQYMLCWGRRSSKSTVVSIYLAFILYKILNIDHPQEYFGILTFESMNITITALGEKNASRIFSRFWNIVKPSPFFKPFIREEPTGNTLKLWTTWDLEHLKDKGVAGVHTNSINVFALPNTPGVRGEGNFAVVMDEYAHFNSSASSTRQKPLDEEIYEALTPSISGFKHPDGSPFGRTLLLSSPNGKRGHFYDQFKMAMEEKDTSGILAIRAATWEINTNIASAFLRREYNNSPASFSQEYGAEFIEGGVGWIRDLAAYYASVDTRLVFNQKLGRIDRQYFMGVDFALSSDGTAVSLCHYEVDYDEPLGSFSKEALRYDAKLKDEFQDRPKHKYVIDYSEVRYAGQPPYEGKKTLLIEDILTWIEDVYKHWPIRYGIYDQWSGVLIDQMVKNRGIPRLEMIVHNQLLNDSQYKLFSNTLHSGELKIPNDPELHKELLALQVEFKEKGVIKVEAPVGLHDDRFDSIIRSLFICQAYVNKTLVIGDIKLSGLFNKDPLIRRGSGLSYTGSPGAFKKQQENLHLTGNLRNPKARPTTSYRRG